MIRPLRGAGRPPGSRPRAGAGSRIAARKLSPRWAGSRSARRCPWRSGRLAWRTAGRAPRAAGGRKKKRSKSRRERMRPLRQPAAAAAASGCPSGRSPGRCSAPPSAAGCRSSCKNCRLAGKRNRLVINSNVILSG